MACRFTGSLQAQVALNPLFQHLRRKRRQAMFIRERGRWHLMDLNSTNKTYLNGEALKPYILEPLAPGDEIRFANQDPICFDL